jgi:hypothetical protein
MLHHLIHTELVQSLCLPSALKEYKILSFELREGIHKPASEVIFKYILVTIKRIFFLVFQW